jgi:hypothetical protein
MFEISNTTNENMLYAFDITWQIFLLGEYMLRAMERCACSSV